MASAAAPSPGSTAASDVEVEELFARLASDLCDETQAAALREQIITQTLPLARNIARRFAGRGQDLDDLFQVASVGLVNAVNRFDPARGIDFAAFAIPTITGEIRRYFRDHTWSTRVPRRLKDLHLSINKTTGMLAQRLGRSPTAAELAAELGVEPDEIIEALAAAGAYQARSLDTPLYRDAQSEVTLADTLVDERNELESSETYLALRPALDELPARERRMIMMRFLEEKSQTEIARELGISQVHVSRLLTKTLSQMRASLES